MGQGHKFEIIYTNIFCLLGRPGSGRTSVLKNVLLDKEFIEKHDISRFTYGTTRAFKPDDIMGVTYFFFTDKEFQEILKSDPGSIIESRSYDLIGSIKPNYYFTLKDHIKFGTNYIGRVSLYQYEELKSWAEKNQLKMPTIQINIYPIMVDCGVFECFDRLEIKLSDESDLYNLFARMVSERYEYEQAVNDNPEVIDTTNRNTLFLDNRTHDFSNIPKLAQETKDFIDKKLNMQGVI